ncbi:MAG: adenosylcobalamin-dependent ribonucleoside-diphosphate reductase [Flavobacteriales bacterium]|nr:adenosylcobalamin-dependent ribonucleoside-diphosphate reductase [Flavobacteriales bacterium]MBT3962613.1 adenosylcobalamin-dependent ribonucleoside-diphosphate reductase [Flavobacteriales bacterium]MBT4705025.1 adenosylcobalamin-dependent ribonucleoside-diphosphate reductase [Flavobacteriales bacterium]MBT4929800.1 adenosylcobalamin-dependent ribonucleoside-diphosphate reductase [Flavobacteriales bacterium]MBT5133269.1 adenosylcobalamin-dependent ribonucleoside-diphosphate reductase [Flavob
MQETLEKDISVRSVTDNRSKSITYSYDEVLAESTVYFEGDELAATVWMSKYALKDSDGKYYEKSPDDMHHRLASEIARVDGKHPHPLEESDFFEALARFQYIIPQGGPMSGIGNDHQVVSLSNCFVIGHSTQGDSYGAIMQTDQEQVQLMKRRGGVGHDLSHIRPKGSPVKNSALTSTGVVPFMERFSNSTREVAQDGRRGALMLSISIEHPDAEDFIDAKLDQSKVTGANISVKITDDFMQAVIKGDAFIQRFPVGSNNPTTTKEIDASSLWEKIVHNAWKSAEPGILFWDTIKRESVADCYEDEGFGTVSTNPCGEIPLCPYDSCRLLAINLLSFVNNPFSEEAEFDFVKFKRYVRMAQRIADNIIDLELEKIDSILEKIGNDPESKEIKRTERNLWLNIKEKCQNGRRTGTGITAEGDMLAALGLTYGSQESIEFSEKVHRTLAIEAYRSSVELARDRGSFPIYDAAREVENPFIQRLLESDPNLAQMMAKHGRRNIAILTIAPTGTTSMMTQTSSGIEPVFMVAYKRRKKINPNDKNARVDFVDEVGDHWQEYNVFHRTFEKWLQLKGYNLDEVKSFDHDRLEKLIQESPYKNATAQDVDWVKKVELQGAIQKWVDHSISVTVNIPNEATTELVNQIYQESWEAGCKGITVYRDGSRSGVLVSDDNKDDAKSISDYSVPPKRPETLDADVVRFNNGTEPWISVIGLMKDEPYEIFTGRAEDSFHLPESVTTGFVKKVKDANGKSRYDFIYLDRDGYEIILGGLSRSFDPEYWNYAKLISGVLRHGMPLPYVVHMVDNLHLNDDSLNTWKSGVIRGLKRYIQSGSEPVDNVCPKCEEEALVYEEGCLNCKSCGHSKCS